HRLLCDNPTAVKDMRAEVCPHCAADVSGVEQSEGETYDHVEIPLVPAVTTRVVLRHGTHARAVARRSRRRRRRG
ncbi:MAG: hypothetical protein ACJ8AI_14920, partial [Rhodopila sp.]